MFKCEVMLMSENLLPDGSCDGNIYDSGIVETYTDSTISGLMKKLKRQWSKDFIDGLEVYENRLENSIVNKSENTLETFSLYFTEVLETEIYPTNILGLIQD